MHIKYRHSESLWITPSLFTAFKRFANSFKHINRNKHEQNVFTSSPNRHYKWRHQNLASSRKLSHLLSQPLATWFPSTILGNLAPTLRLIEAIQYTFCLFVAIKKLARMSQRTWDPFKTYDLSRADRRAVEERAQLRAGLKAEWQKKVTNPHRGMHGSVVSDLVLSFFTVVTVFCF